MFHYKKFQREDYARMACHDGLILAHDTGAGKTIGMLTFPLLKCGLDPDAEAQGQIKPAAATLLIVPGDGHAQTRDESKLHFKAPLTTLDSQETFRRLSSVNPHTASRILPPGYYITSYTELTGNGVRPFPELGLCLDAPLDDRHPLNLTPECVQEYFDSRAQRFSRQYAMLQVAPADTLATLDAAWQLMRKSSSVDIVTTLIDEAYHALRKVCAATMDDLTLEQLDWCRRETVHQAHKKYQVGIGDSRHYAIAGQTGQTWKIKCVYSPTLADECSDSFECVCVDEGVKMKAEDTKVALGVRQMIPRYRLVLTATPVKNRLPDIFRLGWWAAGGKEEGHARFPYGDSSEEREDFSREFMLAERNIDKEQRTNKRQVKLTPQVCNIHLLWKFLAPVVLRRRKKDFGEDIVPKHRHVVRVPMGQRQRDIYKFHLGADYRDKNGLPAIGAKLQALRICASDPSSELLERPDGDSKSPHIKPRSTHDYVPKLASVLNLIRDLLAQGEQALVFSAFHDSLDTLSARLREAGVEHTVCDGRMSQTQRGRAAKQFKAKKYSIMLASVESMAELHSFPQCSHVILMAYSWAYDKFEQGINRVHRLNSPKDVHVWSVLCDGSIDGKLEGNIHEKADSAELVLDGQLMDETPSEVNLYELIRIAEHEFASGKGEVLDEARLEQEWPALRAALYDAARGKAIRHDSSGARSLNGLGEAHSGI